MEGNSISQNNQQIQNQSQKQLQHLSQRQIQAVNMLAMKNQDLREEILSFVDSNPAVEIVRDPLQGGNVQREKKSYDSADAYQKALEAQEDRGESLQEHLLKQLRMNHLSQDEEDLSVKLVYNLDKNGFYGSSIAPETLLDFSRPVQTKGMLKKCIERIQKLDPVGTCCKNVEESLYVQAKLSGDASPLTLFILDGKLEMLNPPDAEVLYDKLIAYKKDWHSKAFAPHIILDDIKLSPELAEESICYIRSLNPYPAGDYYSDTNQMDFNRPDVILKVTKQEGRLLNDDFSNGKVAAGGNHYFQIKYASGVLPEVRLSKTYSYDEENIEKAKAFIANLQFRESSIVLQGCAIVKNQLEFFENGPGHIVPLTRKQLAQQLGIHESTVSRMSGKKNSRFIETEFGLMPASYFFSSGINSDDGKAKISSEVIKSKIEALLRGAEEEGQKLSDERLAERLNSEGIKIARRTVAKYRNQLGLHNSYSR